MAATLTTSSLKVNKPSPFLKLPVEIRLMVYELALNQSIHDAAPSMPAKNADKCQFLCFRGPPALLLTSKSIRAEFSEGTARFVARHYFDVSARISELAKRKDHLERASGQSTFADLVSLYASLLEVRNSRERELDRLKGLQAALYKLAHIMLCTASEMSREVEVGIVPGEA